MNQNLAYQVGLRLAVLSLLLVAMNWIYKRYFFHQDLNKYAEIKEVVEKIPMETEVLYVGESSNISFGPEDREKRAISDLIAMCLPQANVYDLTKPAGHSGIYKELLKQLPEDNNIHTLVLTLNMRTFNAQCIYSHLETSLQQDLVLLRQRPALWNRASLSFKDYDIKSFEEREGQVHRKWEKEKFPKSLNLGHKHVKKWYKSIEKEGVLDENGNPSPEKTQWACTYVKSFGFVLDTNDNPRIDDFNQILEMAKERDWNVLFNLLAEDVEGAEKLVGRKLSNLMIINANNLAQYYENKGYTVVNNIDQVGYDQFFEKSFPTEHYAEHGRKKIAQHVALALSKQLNGTVPTDSFQSLLFSKKHNTPLRYFNGCERNLHWGQTHSITREEAYKGKHSSRTGGNKPFSITCEIPLKNYDDSISSIEVNMMVKSNEPISDSIKLILEASGEHIKYYAQDLELKPIYTQTGKWQSIQHHFSIPTAARAADVVKIYVYNPTETNLFIDDYWVVLKVESGKLEVKNLLTH